MLTTPNNDQKRILQCPNKVILIKAVAGAGKTTAQAMVIQQEIENGRSPKTMIGLCFSRGARMRFHEKLREETEIGSSVFVMTLEDLARKLIEDLAKKRLINLPRHYRDFDGIRGELVAATARVWERHKARGETSDFNFQFDENNQRIADLACRMSEMKASLSTHDFADGMSEDGELSHYAEESDRPKPELEIVREYENRRHPYLDEFIWQGPHDAVSDLVFLLKHRPELLNELYRWSLLLVDEWHDVNAAEFELIRLLRRGAKLVVVGDKDQTINTERGADPKFSGEYFISAYRNADAISLPLGRSYRFGNDAAAMARRIVNNDCLGHPEKETLIRRVRYNPSDYGACAEAVTQTMLSTLSEKRDGKIRSSDFAIVLRDVDQAVEIETALMEARIPYICDGFESFLLLPEILMLLGILHYVSNDFGTLSGNPETSRPMVLALSRYFFVTRDPSYWKFNSEEKKSVLLHAQDDIAKVPETLKYFFDGVLLKECEFDGPLARRWKEIIHPVIQEMKRRSASATADELLDYLNSSVDLQDATSRAFVNRDRADSATRSIKSFLKFVARHGRLSTAQFLKRLSTMQNDVAGYRKSEVAGKLGKPQSLVRVTTIQAAKGREWKYVLLPYLDKSEFMRSSDSQLDLRTLYVGITRAIRELMLFEPNDEFIHHRITQLAPRR